MILLAKLKTNIIGPAVYLLLIVATVVFLWGVVEFIWHLDNEESRKIGAKHMIWGIIGLAIMLGVKGILTIICNTVGCDASALGI